MAASHVVVEDRVDVYIREECSVQVRTPVFYGSKDECEAFIDAELDFPPEFQHYEGKLSVIDGEEWQETLRLADSEGEMVDDDE